NWGASAGAILIGGSTSYDGNLTALFALMAEWSRPGATYQTRINHLNGSLGGGLNGSFVLGPGTVLNDGAVDSLVGDPLSSTAVNWFFASANDQRSFVRAGEVVTNY